jgi:hypothetical protein
MKFMVVSEQVTDLKEDARSELYEAMNQFYSNIPPGVRLEKDYIRADRLGSYSILEVENREAVTAVMAPFDGLVHAQIIELIGD